MGPRERVRKVLAFEEPDRIPRQLWASPAIGMFRRDDLRLVNARFPSDFTGPDVRYGRSGRETGTLWQVGSYVDAWGCVWTAGEPGVIGEVLEWQMADWRALDDYRLPWSLLDEADFSRVNASVAATDRFVTAGTETRPFERMQFLRGTENVLMDLATGSPELLRLRDMLHEFFLREMSLWAETDVDAVSFMDDWGSQNALLVDPAIWRRVFKPLYRDYCDILRKAGKYAFFHSDGNIEAILPDLVEIGVSAVNAQLFCMDIEGLGARHAGKIVFLGEIDRQRLLPFGTTEEIRAAVRRTARALMPPSTRTGATAECAWGAKDPVENVLAYFEEWDRI